MFRVLSAVLVLGLATQGMAQECYRFFGPFDFPDAVGQTGKTSFEAVNNQDVGLGRDSAQDDNGYQLWPRNNATQFTRALFAALVQGKNIGRGLNDFRDRCGLVQLPGHVAGFVRLANGTVQILEVPGQMGTECLDIDNLRNTVGHSFRIPGPTGGGTDGWWRYRGQFYTINHPQGVGNTTLTSIVSQGGLNVQILGWRGDALGRYHSFLYTPTTAPDVGTFTDLDAPGGSKAPDGLDTFLRSMNDAGDLVGEVLEHETHEANTDPARAVLVKGGVWYDLHPPFPGAVESHAVGITNGSKVLGNVRTIDNAGGEKHLGWIALPDPTCTAGTPLPVLTE